MSSVKQFWNERAALGETAGTQDLIAKELEVRAILDAVKALKPKRILEVGCGRGELARAIMAACPFVNVYFGVDNAQAMVDAALAETLAVAAGLPHVWGFFCCELENLPPGPFDCIITERMLINLPDAEAQRRAVRLFMDRLAPRGRYLMCENHQSALDYVNEYRVHLGLPSIEPPWHNRYLPDNLMGEELPHYVDYFSAAYYLLSRIVNAKIAHDAGTAPDYNSPINRLALDIDADCVDAGFAIGQLWVWEKA